MLLTNGANGGEAAKICSVVRSQKMLIYQWVGLCVSALILLTFLGFENQLTLCCYSANGNGEHL
jgi:hypothetical protein